VASTGPIISPLWSFTNSIIGLVGHLCSAGFKYSVECLLPMEYKSLIEHFFPVGQSSQLKARLLSNCMPICFIDFKPELILLLLCSVMC
jgi:hypothetical protein